MAAKIFIFIIIGITGLNFAMPASAQNNQTCRWIYRESNDTEACQRIFNSEKWVISERCDASTKGLYDNTCCCPTKTSPKYIIIGSLAVLLGGAAILIAIFRKNEVQ